MLFRSVTFQVLFPREAGVAHVALERLHVAVGHDVQLELVEPVKLFGTVHVLLERALEQLVVVVDEAVALELVLAVELGATLVAGEGQLARVDQLVRLEIGLSLEGFLANITGVRAFGVRHGNVLPPVPEICWIK